MSVTSATAEKHPVDQVPPLSRLVPLGLQHVLAMYAGAVAVPLVVGGALIKAGKLESGDLAYLISADLLVAGIATLIQSFGFWRFGVRLPLMQGCTFAAVSPMIAIGSQYGVAAIYGSVIACGLFMMLLAPVFSKLLRFFPPLVTGTVILIIGLSLMSVAAGWAGGGSGAPNFGSPKNLIFALLTLVIILLIERFAPPAHAAPVHPVRTDPRHADLHPVRHGRLQRRGAGELVRRQHPLPLRGADLPGQRHHGHVHRGPGDHDRDHRRHHRDRRDRRQAGRAASSWPTGCGRTACPPCWAGCSTPSPTPPSRRTSVWCR